MIYGLRLAGRGRGDICRSVQKKDGKYASLRAVDAVLAKKRANPCWLGQDSRAGGRPLSLTPAQRGQLRDLVFKMHGRAVKFELTRVQSGAGAMFVIRR